MVSKYFKCYIRREYKTQFEAACNAYRKANAHRIGQQCSYEISNDKVERKIRVYSRKRPIFKREIDNGEFDCVTCLNGGAIVVHDARMRNDMIHQFMKHNEFKFFHTFSEVDSNETVYVEACSSIIRPAVLNNSHSTCMVYGQTGSGKFIIKLLKCTDN